MPAKRFGDLAAGDLQVGEVVTMIDLRHGSMFPVRIVATDVDEHGRVLVDDVDTATRFRVGPSFLTRDLDPEDSAPMREP